MALLADVTRLNAPDGTATCWRAFGRIEDLDIRFGRSDRPALVSEVLSACAPEGLVAAHIWALSLAERVGGLLAIWARGVGRSEVELGLRCPAEACGSALEVTLPVADLLAMAEAAAATPENDVDGVRLRRPTGDDQRRWLASEAPVDEAAILSDLVVEGDVSALSDPAEILAEFDPLTCFCVQTTCPDCGRVSLLAVDLEAHLLRLLAREQGHMFREVDILARRYGWRDSEILEMSPQRRRHYLRIVEEEGSS